MTTETKTFIQLSDIIALCFKCKHDDCGASLHLTTNQMKKGALTKCPNCGRGWTDVRSGITLSENEAEFIKFAEAVEYMKRLTGEGTVFDFSLTVQINNPQSRP
jgi:hypothetical protein